MGHMVNTLTVASMERLNKKQYLLHLNDGQVMQLSITDMFSISIVQEDKGIAHIRFQPLSSLNNIEMQPIYRITDYHAPAGILASLSEGFLDVMVTVYAFYTQGSIRPLRAFATPEVLAV
jgi:hypothetical protein